MDREAQIAAEVAKRIPSAGPEKAPVVKDAPSKTPAETLVKTVNYETEISAIRLMDHYEIPMADRRDRELIDRLNYIYGWAAEKVKSDDSVDVLTHLRDLESRLGIQFRENKIDALYRWIKLDKERRRIEKEQALV